MFKTLINNYSQFLLKSSAKLLILRRNILNSGGDIAQFWLIYNEFN